jgi:pSer/pThr/pTyr-binding forkhead associated (FHA) protein
LAGVSVKVFDMDAKLRILSGPFAGKILPVPQGKLLVGREDDCLLRLESDCISRHHCALLLDEYTLRILDLGSTNGTFVNGRRIGRGQTMLLHDDVVALDATTFRIELAAPCEESVVVSVDQTSVPQGDTIMSVSPAQAIPGPEAPPPIPMPIPVSAPLAWNAAAAAVH